VTPQQRNAMDWEGRTLLDRDGDKIGRIEEIYLVEETGRPEWALVKLGRLGSRATLVPLTGADPIAEGIRAAFEKSLVSDAPRIDADGEPSEQEVAAVYRHYGIDGGEDANGREATKLDEGSAQAAHMDITAGAGNGVARHVPEVLDGSRARSSDKRDESAADLLKQVSDEATTLVRQEIKLATAEMTEKAKQVGVGAGMFGGAGYTLHLASLGLMLCLIFALATAMAAWLAALVVTVVFVAIAGVLALVGKKRIQKAGPPIPEEAIESVKQTIETVKEEAKWGLGQTR
jgi:uncharacterized membrane protein YqjE